MAKLSWPNASSPSVRGAARSRTMEIPQVAVCDRRSQPRLRLMAFTGTCGGGRAAASDERFGRAALPDLPRRTAGVVEVGQLLLLLEGVHAPEAVVAVPEEPAFLDQPGERLGT